MNRIFLFNIFLFTVLSVKTYAQVDSSNMSVQHKNVVRYNLSGALLFGFDKYIVFGYERVVGKKQSFSINLGRASLPKPLNISTDSFSLSKSRKRTGYNISVDYRFYLANENKYAPPHGVYIGPYYSYNHFESETQWDYSAGSGAKVASTTSKFNINTIGFEIGYQFILWKRLAIDLVMVGPGLGFYNYKVTFDDSLSPTQQEQLQKALEQLVTQRFPGMNYVFSDKEFNSSGTIKTSSIGYRYLIQIGYNF